MITEYKGFSLTDRNDFKVQEIGENVTIFLFDPYIFSVKMRDIGRLEANLAYETNATFSLIADEAMKGIIILILNPTVEHRYNNEDIKDAIIKYLFDHHIVNYI